MAMRIANGNGNIGDSIWEPGINNAVVSTSTGSLTAAGLFTAAWTAPNTTNKTTGVCIYVVTKPSNGGNIVVTLQEATVDTACTATINNADIKLGPNYVRFPTPYQWTATTAGRYRFKVANSVGTSGLLSLIAAASTLSFVDTYDSPSTLGSTDDFKVLGHNASGNTPITVTVNGTGTVQGSGSDKAVVITTPRTNGAGIEIGSGGKLIWDTTANATLQTRGTTIVWEGGTYQRKGNASDRSIIAKHIIDCETANGNYGVLNMPGATVDLTGATVTDRALYASGSGTAASPLITATAMDFKVGEQLVIESTDTYDHSETRFIKTVNSSTSYVLSTTVGGAEAALTYTHTTSAMIYNFSRNSVFEAQTSTRGYFFVNNNTTQGNTKLDYSRFTDPDVSSGHGIQVKSVAGTYATCDYAVGTGGNLNRDGFRFALTTDVQTVTGLGWYLASASNTNNAPISILCKNMTFTDCYSVGAVGYAMSFSTAYNITVNNFRATGSNTSNSAASVPLNFANSGTITVNSSYIQATRKQAILVGNVSNLVFNDCRIGDVASNEIDISAASDTLNDVVFNNSTFGSPILTSNTANMVTGSRIGFHRYQNTDRRHRTYKSNVNFQATGSGLTDTLSDTTFDSTSLAFRLEPLDAVTYGSYTWQMPQRAGNTIVFSGKIYFTAAFNGDAKVEMFLDGSDTADDTYTLSGSNSTWIPFVLSADYTAGTVDRNATVKVSVRGTAGYIYLDTFFNAAKSTNPIGSLDLWQDGAPNQYLVSTVASASEIAGAVWADSATYNAGTKGDDLKQTKKYAKLAAVK